MAWKHVSIAYLLRMSPFMSLKLLLLGKRGSTINNRATMDNRHQFIIYHDNILSTDILILLHVASGQIPKLDTRMEEKMKKKQMESQTTWEGWCFHCTQFFSCFSTMFCYWRKWWWWLVICTDTTQPVINHAGYQHRIKWGCNIY